MPLRSLGRLAAHPLTWVAAALCAFFSPELVGGRVFSPADYLFRIQPWATVKPAGWSRPANDLRTDEVLIFLPRMLATGRDLARHGIPLWQQHSLVGTENTLSLHFLGALAWPPMLGFAVLPAGAANTLFHLPVLAVAAFAMYRLLRTLTSHPLLQALGALAWALNGYFVVWLSAYNLPLILAVLPLLVLWTTRFLETGLLRFGLAFAALFGWTLLLGYPPANLISVAALAVFGLASTLAAPRRRLPRAAGLAGLALLGCALGAVSVATQLAELGSQASGQYRFIIGALPTWALPTLVLPNLYGSPIGTGFQPPSARTNLNFAEITGYFGGSVLALAGAGAAIALLRRRWWAGAALVTAGLGLLAAYGAGPAAWAEGLPVLQSVRPGRWIVLTAFGGILLAVHGLDSALAERRLRPALAGAGGLLVVGLLAAQAASPPAGHNPGTEFLIRAGLAAGAAIALVCFCLVRDGRRWIGAVVLLAAADLISFGAPFNPTLPAAQFYPRTPALDYLAARSAGYRTLVSTPDHVLWGGDVLNVYGIDSVTGYDHFRHSDLLALLGPSVDPWDRQEWEIWGFLHLGPTVDYSAPALDELGVRFAYLPLGTQVPAPASPGWRQVYAGPDGLIYENSGALPGRFLVSPAGVRTPLPPPSGANADSDRVSAEGPGILVWSHASAPGWRLSVDGKPAAVEPYRGYFMAVALPAGRHQITADYRPRDYQVGGAISGAALLIIGVLAAGAVARRGLPLPSRRPAPTSEHLFYGGSRRTP